MIPVSEKFKNAMKSPVKELDAYIVGDVSIKSADDLISFKISAEGGLCKTVMRKLEAKFTGGHNLLGQWVRVGYGVKLDDGTFEYLDYGSFLITETTTSKDTDVTSVVGYDKMINSMKQYKPLEVEYPINLYDYTKKLCESCGLELSNELFGKNIPRLPNEYQEVEYIESTSTNARFNTGVSWEGIDTKITVDIQCLATTEDSIVLIQRGESPTSANWSGAFRNKWGAGTLALYDISCLERVTLNSTFTSKSMITELNGVTKTREVSGGGANTGYFYIGTYYSYSTLYRLYSAKIEQNGEIIRNFIPCYRKSDNVIGLYDLVNNVFYTKDSTGTLIKGIDVNVPSAINNWLIDKELWANIDGITYRDILVQIAQATATTCIITDDKVNFKSLTETGETLTYDNMFKLKLENKYGEINSVVLSRTPQEDNIYMRDEESINTNGLTEFKIENNEIIDKDRDNAMTPIYEALKGINYYPFETSTEGLGWFEIGDKLNIVNNNGDVFNTALFNFNISIDGSIKETLKTSAETKTQTQYQYATTINKRIKNTEIIVNKQEQYIESLVADMYNENGIVNNNFTKVYQDIDEIVSSVQNSGGNNLIKNSVMFAYDNNKKPNDWSIIHAGKNIADIKFEQGYYAYADGTKYGSTNYIRTSEKIDVVEGETYTLSFKGTQPTSWDSGFTFFKDGVYHTCLAQKGLTFTVPAGVNQVAYNLCNSTGITPTDVYDVMLERGNKATTYEAFVESELIIDTSNESLNAGCISGNGFTLLNKIATQKVVVSTDSIYTFSTRIKKGKVGSCYVKLYNSLEEHIIEVKNAEESFYKEYVLQSLQPKENYYIVEFYGSIDSDVIFTDNMLALGEYKSKWTQANGEIMNTQVNVNLDGVLVRSSVYLGDYTVMSPLEFAGYSYINGTITRVFSLNKDVTEVTKLWVQKEIKMVPLKIVPVLNGAKKGWAIVPATEGV